jgi:long-chain acyl-CoA synthetase
MACLGLTAADHYLLALPLFHITALGMAMAHMHAGAASVLVPRFDAEEAVRLIDRHRVTHVSDFPPVLTSLLDAAGKLGSRLASLEDTSPGWAFPRPSSASTSDRAQFWTGFGCRRRAGFVASRACRSGLGAAGS